MTHLLHNAWRLQKSAPKKTIKILAVVNNTFKVMLSIMAHLPSFVVTWSFQEALVDRYSEWPIIRRSLYKFRRIEKLLSWADWLQKACTASATELCWLWLLQTFLDQWSQKWDQTWWLGKKSGEHWCSHNFSTDGSQFLLAMTDILQWWPQTTLFGGHKQWELGLNAMLVSRYRSNRSL